MSSKGKADLIDLNVDVVKNYIYNRESTVLTEREQRMMQLVLDAYKLVDKHGLRSLAINEFRAEHEEYSLSSAQRYVDTAMTLFNANNAIDRRFLENWTLKELSRIVTREGVEDSVKTKALSSILKHLENMPPENTDPKLRESNVVGVVFAVDGLDGKILTESVIQGLDLADRHTLLSQMGNQIDAKRAAEIMDVPYVELKED